MELRWSQEERKILTTLLQYSDMAPNLSNSKHDKLQKLILSYSSQDVEIAKAVPCSVRTVVSARSNLRLFGSTKAPPNGRGRPPSIPSHIADAILEHLTIKQHLYLDEVVDYVWDEFEAVASTDAISSVLRKNKWTKKTARKVAQERCPELRSACRNQLSEFFSFQKVFVDESGTDRKAAFRRTGWAPVGTTPVQNARFHRGRRYQIIPAYAQDGIVYAQIFQGSTDAVVFEEFIRELLKRCGRYPAPKSVLVMDNASIHRSERIDKLCEDAGVKIIYLSPYSPDLNPAEGLFAQLKRFVRRRWKGGDDIEDFGKFLKESLDIVGSNVASAEGHFRNSGLTVTQP